MSAQNDQERVRPILKLFTEDQIESLHRYSLKILSDTGIRVDSKAARKVFLKSKDVKEKNDIIYIGKDLVNYAIKTSPSNIEMFDRSGKTAFNLGSKQAGDTFFGIGVTNPFFQEIGNAELIPFTREHMQHSTSLGNMLNNYSMISTLGIPNDVEPGSSDLYSALDMYANTEKPLVLLISDEHRFGDVLDLFSYLHGDISSKPICIPYVNPITPLVLNKSTTDKMIASINSGLPVMFSNYGMYGASTPATEGGSLALLNAELLAGLVFSQLVKEGSEIILGSLPAAFNMKSMGSRYTPSTYLMNIASSEMMDYYGIPHCGTSGSSNGWGTDLLAAGDLWQNHLSSVIGKVGCAPFVGGNFDSLAFSPTNIILSDHIIGKAKKFARGFSLNDHTVNLSEIDNTGHGGNYLTTDQTLSHLSELSEESEIWPSLPLAAWKKAGSPKAEKILIDYSLDLYYQAINSSKENQSIIKKGEEFISKILR